MPVLDRQRYVDIPAETIAGGHLGRLTAGFDRLFFLVSWSSPQVAVEPIDPDEVARRMVASLQHERLDFMGYYWKFRFAFPGRRSEIVERAEEIERDRLRRALAGKPAYRVGHPYPVALAALYDAISPSVDDNRRTRRPFTVALVGADGAGKTTVARSLPAILPFPAVYLYMGVAPASSNYALPTTRVAHAIKRMFGRGSDPGPPGRSPRCQPTGRRDRSGARAGRVGPRAGRFDAGDAAPHQPAGRGVVPPGPRLAGDGTGAGRDLRPSLPSTSTPTTSAARRPGA
jgi:hypothetical protein